MEYTKEEIETWDAVYSKVNISSKSKFYLNLIVLNVVWLNVERLIVTEWRKNLVSNTTQRLTRPNAEKLKVQTSQRRPLPYVGKRNVESERRMGRRRKFLTIYDDNILQ